MAGNGISGKDGDVKIGSVQIAEIKKWNFNPKSNNPAYASNKTGGYKKRVAGVKDGSGSMDGVWDPTTPAVTVIDVGTSVDLKLYINATQFYDVPSIIGSFKLEVDVDSGAIVGWTADFETNGAWTNPVGGLTLPEGVEPPVGEEDDFQFVPDAPLRTEGAPDLEAPREEAVEAPGVPAKASGPATKKSQAQLIAEAVADAMAARFDTRLAALEAAFLKPPADPVNEGPPAEAPAEPVAV